MMFQFKNVKSDEPGSTTKHGIGFLGWYKDGFAHGNVWIEMVGGGLLHGKIQETDHKLTGDEIMYLYPDYDTMFVGTFEDKMMIKAKEASLKQVGCDDKTGLPIISAYDLAQDDVIYSYDPPTNISFGGGSLGVLDPFERKNLELKESSIPNSGDGVFSKMHWPAELFPQVVSIYDGFTYDPEQLALYRQQCPYNISKTDDERRHCAKYTISICSGMMINIPPEFDLPETFHPTHGPKVNHHFINHNCAYECNEHPRFGLIVNVAKYPEVEIKPGDELFTNYGYKKRDFPNDIPWYWEAKAKVEREQEELAAKKARTTTKSKKQKV